LNQERTVRFEVRIPFESQFSTGRAANDNAMFANTCSDYTSNLVNAMRGNHC